VKRGLRLEWLVAFGALLLLSFTPLYFAVSRLTEASMLGVRERSAKDLGRAIAGTTAALAGDASTRDAVLASQIDARSALAVAVYDASGARLDEAGMELDRLPATLVDASEGARQVVGPPHARVLVIAPPHEGGLGVAVLLSVEASSGPLGPLVSLIALYTGVVALALLVFGYFLMTRLVVRPLEDLSRAAGRVAAGGRKLEHKPTGRRELDELGESLSTMTERLRAEEESLRAKVVELETATRELKSAQSTLVRSERLASVGRLAAGLAHEIGNPIAAILGFEELLIEGDLPADEAKDFLVRMKKETERVNAVLRNLLDFARAPTARPAGTGEIRAREDVDPGSVGRAIDTVVTLIAPQRGLKGVAIERDVSDGLPLVDMSDEHLTQVLLNLVLNAGDAAPSDGGKIAIAARVGSAGSVTLTVEDNGSGIAPEIAATLFEPFATTKDVGKGTGLGLSVCKGLVEAVGGSISADKSPLGGARFTIELPPFAPESKKTDSRKSKRG
jgi:two-component system NtrC family sensor kinase